MRVPYIPFIPFLPFIAGVEEGVTLATQETPSRKKHLVVRRKVFMLPVYVVETWAFPTGKVGTLTHSKWFYCASSASDAAILYEAQVGNIKGRIACQTGSSVSVVSVESIA